MGAWFSAHDLTADVPDLSGKTALVTGANRGLGYAVCLALLAKGARVYVAARSLEKAEQAVKEIEAGYPEYKGRAIPLEVDLSSVKRAKAAGEEVVSKEGENGRLDILINNAAATGGPYAETEEGISTSIASNHLGHFALTLALLPLLERTASLPDADVRVLNISSTAHTWSPKRVQFKTVADFRNDGGSKEAGFRVEMTRYGHTKLCNILFSKQLQRRWAQAGIPAISISVHPGAVATPGAKNFMGTLYLFIGWGFIPPEQAAKDILFDAASPKVRKEGWGGKYLVPGGKPGTPIKEAEDPQLAQDLWDLSERVCKEIEETGRAA